MAVERSADALWKGSLAEGGGTVRPASGAFGALSVNWRSRAEKADETTSPEELIAAAHASCFSMALSHGLTEAGHFPEELNVTATVGFEAGVGITAIHLHVRGKVPGADEQGFASAAAAAAENCPVSKALSAVAITHSATLS